MDKIEEEKKENLLVRFEMCKKIVEDLNHVAIDVLNLGKCTEMFKSEDVSIRGYHDDLELLYRFLVRSVNFFARELGDIEDNFEIHKVEEIKGA